MGTTTHNICNNAGWCQQLDGGGTDLCTTPGAPCRWQNRCNTDGFCQAFECHDVPSNCTNQCPTTGVSCVHHNICNSAGWCQQVDGPGADQCPTPGASCVHHNICNDAGWCQQVDGPGSDQCTTTGAPCRWQKRCNTDGFCQAFECHNVPNNCLDQCTQPVGQPCGSVGCGACSPTCPNGTCPVGYYCSSGTCTPLGGGGGGGGGCGPCSQNEMCVPVVNKCANKVMVFAGIGALALILLSKK